MRVRVLVRESTSESEVMFIHASQLVHCKCIGGHFVSYIESAIICNYCTL